MKTLIEIIKQAAWLRRARKAEQARRDAKPGSIEWATADDRLRQLLGAPQAGRVTPTAAELDAMYRQVGV